MRRFAIFAAVLIVIVAIGSRPSHGRSTYGSGKGSFGVCLSSRAEMMLKSIVNRSRVATVRAASIRQVADKATTAQ